MSKLLILARGDGRNYCDLSGRSIVRDLPVESVVFTDKANARHFEGLGDSVIVDLVRWSDLADVRRRATRDRSATANRRPADIAALG